MSSLIDLIRTHWHEVPSDAVIPDDMEFAIIWTGGGRVTQYTSDVVGTIFREPHCGLPRFTPEPLPVEPDFELPTTPGALIIAHDSEDETRRVFLRTSTDYWADPESFYCDDMLIDPQPAIVIPNGVGVMDETDKRDRVDADGDRWAWDEKYATWGYLGAERRYGTIAAFADDYGPLRFADEVSEA